MGVGSVREKEGGEARWKAYGEEEGWGGTVNKEEEGKMEKKEKGRGSRREG